MSRVLKSLAHGFAEFRHAVLLKAGFLGRFRLAILQKATWKFAFPENQSGRQPPWPHVAKQRPGLAPGAAAEAAKEAAQNVAAEAERKLADTHGLIDSLRAELLNSEVARAEGATRSREEMDQLSARLSEAREPIIVGVLRNGKGLLEGIDFQFGSERVRVGAIRNAAGKIVEMRRR